MSVMNTPLFSQLQLVQECRDRQQGAALLEGNSSPRFADRFFEDARDSHERVSVYLVNGFQLKGEVVSFDEETILFKRIRTGRACGHVGYQLVKRSAVAVMYPLLKSESQAEEWWHHYGACTIDEEATPADPQPTPVTRGGSEMILVVEDDDAVRRAARRILDRYGYTVLLAADGEEALEQFRAHESDIDLVFSDLVMPKMGGRDLYETLERETYGVRYLFTSGCTAQHISERNLLDPQLPFLPKPWTPTDLVTSVRDVLASADPFDRFQTEEGA